jgi:hypothetical protein
MISSEIITVTIKDKIISYNKFNKDPNFQNRIYSQ